jgi:hypothetical protein
MMQEVNEEIQPGNLNQNMQENQNDGDGANMEPDVVDDVVPHHPDQPQDTISFNQSGSIANYLRATGPDIHLSVEDILAQI